MAVTSTGGMDLIEAAYALIKTDQVPQQWYYFLVELAKPNGSPERLQTWVGLQVVQGGLHLVKCRERDAHRIGRIRTFPAQWDRPTQIRFRCGFIEDFIEDKSLFRLYYSVMGTWKENNLPKPASNPGEEMRIAENPLLGEEKLTLNVVASMVREMCDKTRFRQRMNWV